ncbi:mRNA export factor mex67 [Cordyceps fumosorosea ARSEF 2679]|uniref:mRNA export factor mex67 n=1 Tax=Cordyceps fumosorosea (strain ARSEF 2679) TaxID=1081104 RepID=A0A168E142_CORFA|nr:mRNA export factor mex67 [Cordyceps fumosorosea ARSEF 2679]OAA73255.1 mRNA export factor mex67 [Cordyceps fumosorosea ARSEF 2679]
MAPRGARNGGTQPSRGPKATSMKSSAGSRGGIQKKRAGPTKIDGDGDLDMESAARRSAKSAGAQSSGGQARPNTRSSAKTARGTSRTAQNLLKHLANGDIGDVPSRPTRGKPALSYLRVYGLKQSKAATNPDGGVKDLLNFLERKASAFTTGRQRKNVMIKKSHLAGDYLFIGASKADAEELIKLNSFAFAGVPLEIVESDEGLALPNKATESKETQELRAKLQSILSSRYYQANKLLKLDALSTDEELVNLGMFENRERALKTFKGLMVICDDLFKTAQAKRDAIESISVAGNGIDDVVQIENVAITFPQLKNLDLSGNKIATMKAMERWRGKFRELETLYMAGNPIETDDLNYKNTLLEWFPKLQNINGIAVRTAEQIAEREEALKPKPIPQSGPDFRDVNGIGEKFLLEFFDQYDKDRQGLITSLYDESSHFSLAIDTNSVRDQSAPLPLPWAAYLRFSRNLVKITHPNARATRLFKGASGIYDLWKLLPLTQHPNIKTDLNKYIMDCHPLPGLADPSGQNRLGVDGLIITVHGEFDEYDEKSATTGKRSFSRTFVLGPGQLATGIRVVSDILSLRAWNRLPDVFNANAAAPAASSGQAQDQRAAMIVELCKQTGMTPQYSEMCLTQVDFDFAKALAIFQERKAQLPAEAFATPGQ